MIPNVMIHEIEIDKCHHLATLLSFFQGNFPDLKKNFAKVCRYKEWRRNYLRMTLFTFWAGVRNLFSFATTYKFFLK